MTPSPARGVGFAILAIGIGIGVLRGAAQQPVTGYRALVEAYRSGADAASAPWAAELDEWVEAAVSRTSGWNWPELRAAGILHTELWYRDAADGRHDAAARHLNAAIRLFTRLRDVERRQIGFIDRWRACVAALLPSLSTPAQATDFTVRTGQLFPIAENRRAAERDFAAGLGFERNGAERPAVETARPDRSARRWWVSAASSYEAALKKDPAFELAALHLGRIRMLQERTREAAQHFERAAGADDDRVRYLSQMFLGSLAERTGRYADAERWYSGAMRVYPLGQAAPLALSQLFSRTRREADARQLLARHAARAATVEPLWTYLPPPAPGLYDLQLLLNELRAEISK